MEDDSLFYLSPEDRDKTSGGKMQGGGFQKTWFRSRLVDKRLSWQKVFLPFPDGVQAGAGCLAVTDMGTKIPLREGEQAENF